MYIAGDFCSGRIWSVRQGEDGQWTASVLLDSPLAISSFGEDEAGELLVADLVGGTIYRLTSSDAIAAPGSGPTGR